MASRSGAPVSSTGYFTPRRESSVRVQMCDGPSGVYPKKRRVTSEGKHVGRGGRAHTRAQINRPPHGGFHGWLVGDNEPLSPPAPPSLASGFSGH